ncbi:MAG: SurA N-terminal domain-containing protein, partial [Pseudomonadota bacterium]
MLLSMMRKHAKSWLIKVLIGIIALVFVFYFGYSFTAKEGLKIAYVNGELISGMEYQKAYWDLLEALRRQYKDVWNDNLIKVFDLKNRALDNLINQKLISQEARKIGLDVTESEIQQAIMDYPAFQIDGQFDIRRYRGLLNQNRMKPEDFEEGMAKELLDGKLQQFLLTFMPVTDQEVLDYYTHTNEKIKISLVQFKPEKFKKSIEPDQASLETFFEERREGYRVPEKVKLAYLLIDPDTFKDKVVIKDREIEEYYEYNIDTFLQPKEVKARHILLKLGQDAAEEEEKKVREKATKVLEEARKGNDFATLAKKYSEGPTKSEGGDLGYFTAGRMVKPFEDTAFKMKKGEISDLVRTRFGYHIIKVEDVKEARTKALDEVRDQISKILLKTGSAELAHEYALSLIDQMPYDADLAKYTAERELKVMYTGDFSQDQRIPGIGGDDKLRQSLFSLRKGETSELLELKGKFYIFQIADRKESYLPEMAEVTDKLRDEYIAYRSAEEAKAAAESYLTALKEGKAWDELAKEKHLEPEDTELFTRRGPVPKIGHAPDLLETAFSLNRNKRYPDTIFKNDNGAFVIRWEASEGIDESKYQEEKDKYRFSL